MNKHSYFIKMIAAMAAVFACVILIFSAVTVHAATPSRAEAIDEFYDTGVLYIITKRPESGKHGEVWVASANDSVKTLKIDATIKHNRQDYDVAGVVDSAFWGNNNLTSVELPKTVQEIGEAAFERCENLKKVSLPDNLTKIGADAFEGCISLKTVNIPSGLRTAPRHIFSGCISLKEIKFNTNITEIGIGAFEGCESLEKVAFTKKLKKIDEAAFQRCTKLETVSFNSATKLTAIGPYAFGGCSNIKSIALPKNLKTLGDSAFTDNAKLETVKLGSKLKTIGACAFSDCPVLKSVTNGKAVVTIGDSAFDRDVALKTVAFGKKLEKIGVFAFSGTKISSFDFSGSLKSVGEYAFSSTSLKSVNVPGNIKKLEMGVFSHCEKLKSVYLQDGVSTIGNEAFLDCISLETISIPPTVHDIGTFAFEYTPWLHIKKGEHLNKNSDGSSYYSYYDLVTGRDDYSKMPDYIMVNDVCIWYNNCYAEMTEWGYKTRRYKEVYEYPASAKMIVADIGCDNVTKKIVIPNGVEEIRGYINCGGYGDDIQISLPSTLKRLNCQMNGDRLAKITIPSSVEEIGDGAFQGASNLREIKFAGSKLKKIGTGFIMGTAVKSLDIPKSVTYIADGAFANSDLEKLVLPASIKYLGDNVVGNTKVTELFIPDNYELEFPPTVAEKFTLIVTKGTKAEKSLKPFFEKWGGVDGWKVKIK